MTARRMAAAAVAMALLPGALYAAATASDTPAGEQAEVLRTPAIPAADLDSLLVEGTGQPVEVSKALAQDAEQYSSQADGEPLTAQDAGMQNEFALAATEIELAHPDLFVHARVVVEGDKSEADFLIELTSRPSEDIIATLSKISGNTEVTFGGPALTSDATTAASGAALRALREFDEVTGIGASLNEARSGIEVTFNPRAQISDNELTTIHAAVTKAAREASSLPDLEVELRGVDAEPMTWTNNVVGGRGTYLGGVHDCTTGFTAVRGGQHGFVTARHCYNNVTYRNVGGIIDFVANAVADNGNLIDLQFHRTLSPHNTLPQFQWRAANELRTVTSMANPPDNAIICLNAWTVQYVCAQVVTPERCINGAWPETGVPVTVCRLAQTWQTIDNLGDSGGPWFNGGTAFGIHNGHNSEGSLLTRIGAVEARLSANLMMG
ncbi:S1 family peptidase [Nocardioides sp. W7]|uniref:S1 family peptidase n=1 Tax=Nocardioides sp. W7 TaxID=2931390 RepID=UPI001FD1E696|nr:S1 family peptidase [Nocardioides sp. W7]